MNKIRVLSTYELQPNNYTFEDLSEALFNTLQIEYPGSNSEIDNEHDDITGKTNLVINSGVIAVKFVEYSFFSTILGFTPGWDYKHYNKNTSQKIVNLNSTNKKHLKCDVINGSRDDGVRQPILHSFPSGFKVFCEPETIHYRKKK